MSAPGPIPPPEGLCASCTFRKEIPHPRGGRGYIYCKYSEIDPDFRRYPVLPVLKCRGFKPAAPEVLDD